ncbi:MAG: tetratricopeptide repeat protein [Bacteroidota bacterium]
MKKFQDKLPLVLCFLIAIAFSIKSLREPDLWWQIRTGEWILENHQIPKQDVFSYTYEGAKWINVKWGFEVLAALIAKVSGPESIFILQAIISCLLVFFLIKTAKQFKLSSFNLSFSLAALFTLVAAEYRIIGRPEMFSHLFTVVFLFVLLRNHKEESNKIFWLVPLQIFWANFHEAFGIGLVLTAIFTAGSWVEYYLSKRKIAFADKPVPKNISILLLVQVAAVVINPNGITLLTQPLNILGQVYENKYTTELFDFTRPEYWQWNVYWMIGLLLVGLFANWFYFKGVKTKSNRLKLFFEQFGFGYLFVLVAFSYLALTAYRNIIFLGLVFFPLLVFGIDFLLSKAKRYYTQLTIASVVIAVGFYGLIVSNKYYELTKSRDRFGMEVLSTFNPSGAAEFVKKNNLKGRCFSDYLTSSYLLWKLQPEFKTFIDLRDLDVFPSDFFSTFAEAVTFPEVLEKLDSTHHFNYLVLYRPQFSTLHNYLFNQSRFKLAFADAVAAVYVPKVSPSDSSTISFTPVQPVKISSAAFIINKILNPLYSSFDYSSTDNDLLAAGYAINVGRLQEAEVFAQKSSVNNIENYKGKEIMGEVFYNKALQAKDLETKKQMLVYAGSYYQQSLNEQDDYAQTYLGLGAVYFQQQNYLLALANFEKCIEHDKNNLNAYNFAAECCMYFINLNNAESGEYIKRAINLYRKADKLNPDNPTITLNLGFLYFRNNDCNNATEHLSKVSEFQGFTEQQRKNAQDCIRKCAQ